MIRIYQVTSRSRDGALVSKDIILTLADQFLQEVTIMASDDDDCTASQSQIAEVYKETFFLRNSDEIRNTLEFLELDTLVWNMIPDMQAKDIFAMLETH